MSVLQGSPPEVYLLGGSDTPLALGLDYKLPPKGDAQDKLSQYQGRVRAGACRCDGRSRHQVCVVLEAAGRV